MSFCFVLFSFIQGKHIYERGAKNGKRVQSNMGAKNHGVVMPDANKENSLNQLVGAAFGAAGQRCMALSTAVFVGDAQKWLPDLKARAESLKVNAGEWFIYTGRAYHFTFIKTFLFEIFFLLSILGHVPGTDLGPVISPESKKRIHELIESGVKEGAKLLLDGRGLVVPGYEKGNFVGPTILTDVTVRSINLLTLHALQMVYLYKLSSTLFSIAQHALLQGGNLWSSAHLSVCGYSGWGHWDYQQKPLWQWCCHLYKQWSHSQEVYFWSKCWTGLHWFLTYWQWCNFVGNYCSD